MLVSKYIPLQCSKKTFTKFKITFWKFPSFILLWSVSLKNWIKGFATPWLGGANFVFKELQEFVWVMSLPRTFSSTKPITLWETLVKLEWHNDTSGILRVLFGNPSLFLRFVFFDMMTLSSSLRCDIMLLFVAFYFPAAICFCHRRKMADFFVRAEKYFCTRTKYFFYVMQIFLLRIYVLS